MEPQTAAQNEVLVSGLNEPEGPVFLANGDLFVVEMGSAHASVTSISKSGEVDFRSGWLGRPNGMAVDGDGNLWLAEARSAAVVCMTTTGQIVKTITGPAGDPFLWPNDLAFGPDGFLYLTDSGILDTDFIDGIAIRADWAEAPYDGRVYKIDPRDGVVVHVIDRGIRFTNGIAFDAEGALYVNETVGGAVYRYDLDNEFARTTFGNVNKPRSGSNWYGPDGMAFGLDGRLYCAVYGQGDVTVLAVDGSLAERIPTNNALPTNIAFLPDGSGRAVVTEVIGSCVEIIHTGTSGLPLHAPQLLENDK
jgi:gluconolactonase